MEAALVSISFGEIAAPSGRLGWGYARDRAWAISQTGARCRLLTEREISRTWQKLFTRGEIGEETFERAETLIDQLRPESPLRHRLTAELEELRRMKLQEQ